MAVSPSTDNTRRAGVNNNREIKNLDCKFSGAVFVLFLYNAYYSGALVHDYDPQILG